MSKTDQKRTYKMRVENHSFEEQKTSSEQNVERILCKKMSSKKEKIPFRSCLTPRYAYDIKKMSKKIKVVSFLAFVSKRNFFLWLMLENSDLPS